MVVNMFMLRVGPHVVVFFAASLVYTPVLSVSLALNPAAGNVVWIVSGLRGRANQRP